MVYSAGTTGLADRLNRLLDDAGAPPLGRGRLEYLAGVVRRATREKISPQAVRKWLVGESVPAAKKVGLIAKQLGTTSDWLMYGTRHDDAAADQPAYPSSSVLEQRVLHALKDLPAMQAAAVADFVEALARYQDQMPTGLPALDDEADADARQKEARQNSPIT